MKNLNVSHDTQMKLHFILATLMFCFCSMVMGQGIQVTNLDGGVCGNLGERASGDNRPPDTVNEGSSLRRTWIVLNDPSCPIQISDAGIMTSYISSLNRYYFFPPGSVKASKSVRAFEVRYLLYDIFGEPLKTLSLTKITDLSASETLNKLGDVNWNASANEVSQLLTVVAFAAQMRGEDGKIWHFNQKAIADELGRIKFKVPDVFEPTNDKGKN